MQAWLTPQKWPPQSTWHSLDSGLQTCVSGQSFWQISMHCWFWLQWKPFLQILPPQSASHFRIFGLHCVPELQVSSQPGAPVIQGNEKKSSGEVLMWFWETTLNHIWLHLLSMQIWFGGQMTFAQGAPHILVSKLHSRPFAHPPLHPATHLSVWQVCPGWHLTPLQMVTHLHMNPRLSCRSTFWDNLTVLFLHGNKNRFCNLRTAWNTLCRRKPSVDNTPYLRNIPHNFGF